MYERYNEALRGRLKNRRGRKVILWGGESFSDYIWHNLSMMEIPVKYRVNHLPSKSEGDGRDFFPAERLTEEKKDEIFVLGAVCSGHGVIYEGLIALGFKYQEDFSLMGPQGYYDALDRLDSQLGYTRSDDLPGFRIHGDDSRYATGGGIKIVALGGSNTDPSAGNIKSWPEIFHDKLERHHIPNIVYNGGIAGYNSSQDLMKMIRDVVLMKPDFVISYGGLNDIKDHAAVEGHPFTHKYTDKFYRFLSGFDKMAPDSIDMRDIRKVTYGVKNLKADYTIWVDNMRMMHAIAEEFQFCFVGVLQPVIGYGGYQIDEELETLIQEMGGTDFFDMVHFYERAREEIRDKSYILDLSELFSGMSGLYYDAYHVNEEANAQIAEQIWERLRHRICKDWSLVREPSDRG